MIPKYQLRDRFARFVRGDWVALLREGQEGAEEATTSSRRRTQLDSIERRAERAQALVAIGEISSGRSVLEGDPIAPGNEATLNSLRDESGPRALREPLPDHVTNHRPAMEFELDRDRFLKNLRCAKRRAAAGPSGMTSEQHPVCVHIPDPWPHARVEFVTNVLCTDTPLDSHCAFSTQASCVVTERI